MAILGVGAAVGGALFGAGTVAAAVTAAVVNIAISVALSAAMAAITSAIAGEAPGFVGPKLSDTQVSASTWGNGIGIVHGATRIGGNIVQMPADGVTETSEEVGKGGGGGGTTSYKYFADVEIALCESPVDDPVMDVIAIWCDTRVVYDVRSEILLKKRYRKMTVTVRLGEETQTPHSRWEEEWGAGEVPAGRGLVSVLFERLPLIDFGNRVPNITALVARRSIVGGDAFIDWETTKAPTVRVDIYKIDVPRALMIAEGWTVADGHYFIRYDALKGKYKSNGVIHGDIQIPQNRIPHDIDPETGILYASGDPDNVLAINFGVATIYHSTNLGPTAWGDPSSKMENPSDCVVAGSNLLWYLEGGVLGLKNFYGVAKNTLELMWTRNPSTDWGYAQRLDHLVRDPNDSSVVWGCSSEIADDNFRLYEMNEAGALIATYALGGPTQMDMASEDINIRIIPDEPRNQLILWSAGHDRIGLFDLQDRVLKGKLDLDPGVLAQNMSALEHSPSKHGIIWVIGPSNNWYKYDVTGDAPVEVGTLDPSDRDNNASVGYRNILYDEEREMLICQTQWTDKGDGPQFQFLPMDRRNPDTTTLDVIVADYCEKVGIDAAHRDVSDLASVVVRGYVIGKPMTARSAIEPLVTVFFFDGYNGDGKMKFVLRGRSTDHTISQDDVAAREIGKEAPPKIAKKRLQETEVPRRVNLKYIDEEADYIPGVQTDQGEQSQQVEEINIEIPVVLRTDEARDVATKIYRELFVGRDERVIEVGFKHWDVDPTDIIMIEEIK